MTRESDNEPAFYVVQFLDEPFESIDEYVCVPCTWLIVPPLKSDRVVVAYPENEDPFFTRDRVKRKERCDNEWKFYMATVKHKSYSYTDAQSWIAMRNDYGPLVKEESRVTDKQPKFPVNKELRSAYQPKRSRPTKMERNLAIDAQTPSNSIDQTRHLSTRSVQQPIVVGHNKSQNDSRVLGTHTENSRDRTAPLRSIGMTSQEIHRPRINLETSTDLAVVELDTEGNTYDHRLTSQNINMRTPSDRKNSTHLSNLTYQTPELAQQRQMQPNQVDSQQRPKLRIVSSKNPKNRNRKSSLQGVTKTPPPSIIKPIRETLSVTHNDILLNNPQLQARMSPRSTGNNNVDLTNTPQNIIASDTSDRQNSEIPILPIYQPSRKQHTTVHANGYQNLCTQKQLVNQSTQMNSKPKRVHYMDDGARSSVTGSHLNVMENASQRDEYIVKESRSPYHVVPSDSDAVRDHEEVSDCDRAADESPVERTDNVYGTANDPRHDSADRPTADQNSTSTNHQTHSRFILEQQMLDNFAILFTGMDSTLRHTTDMYNTLRSSILDIAKTYKKLLGSVEQFNTAANDPRHDSAVRPTADQNSTLTNHQTHSRFILEQQMLDYFAILFIGMGSTLRHTTDMYNTLRSSILDITETYRKFLGSVEQFNTAAGNTASSASPSSNLTREGSRSPEETHTEVTASASSSYQDQHRIDVANKTLIKKNEKLYRVVLPPEYDADDTRWTLKNQKKLPRLVELMPQSGVYVSPRNLNNCQQVSKDCKSLARRLLPEVFSRNALSVCSSLTETWLASNNEYLLCRPELDKHACSVLLNFVFEYGIRCGWNTDLQPILRALHSEIQKIRFKYGVMVEC
ncbi:uncharacterized protein LOC111000263 isoform X1 [Pieris rapae]|uniref:uncharacterized protein LOC111000263 isoform X1 n=1 Tax=Pieris rapae TaxID=64459 RepID=UPI001E27EB11|nr:uncharacterized protein LOC111000263 isoform X1 [Pieris rapae]